MSAFASETVLVDAAGRREFRLLRCLGEGGFGEVYLAKVRSVGGLEQRVAVKLLRTDVGLEKVLAVDIFRDRVTLRAEDGSTRVAELADLKASLEEAASPPMVAAAPEASPPADRPRRRRRGRGGPGAGA